MQHLGGSSWTTKQTVTTRVGHWRGVGLPGYARFGNDTIFQGPHQWPDTFGRVIWVCPQLGVVPVCAPPRVTGFQAAIESYYGRWQAKAWKRFEHDSRRTRRSYSDHYVAAARVRSAARQDTAPARQPFPAKCQPDLPNPLRGTVVDLHRTTPEGAVDRLGRSYPVPGGRTGWSEPRSIGPVARSGSAASDAGSRRNNS